MDQQDQRPNFGHQEPSCIHYDGNDSQIPASHLLSKHSFLIEPDSKIFRDQLGDSNVPTSALGSTGTPAEHLPPQNHPRESKSKDKRELIQHQLQKIQEILTFNNVQ